MKILYVLRKELDETGKQILERHRAGHAVTCVRLSDIAGPDLVTLIETHDKLIMW